MVEKKEDLTIQGIEYVPVLKPGQVLPKELENIKISAQFLNKEYAELILARNENNRNISENSVGKYFRDMKSGDWPFNGDAIRRDITGNTMDGQQRCTAAKRLDSVHQGSWTLEVDGLSPDVMKTIDGNRPRSLADDLKLDGETHSSTMGAIIKRAYLWEVVGQRWDVFRTGASRSAMMAYFQAPAAEGTTSNKELIRWATKHAGDSYKDVHTYMTQSTFGFMMYLCALYSSREQSYEFWVSLVREMRSINPEHVARRLQSRLRVSVDAMRFPDQMRRVDRPESLAWCIKAWNIWLTEDNPEQTLDGPRGGWNSVNIPRLLPVDHRPEYPLPPALQTPLFGETTDDYEYPEDESD